MAIFFTRGRKAPYQQHVGFSLNNYLTPAMRAELQLRVKEYEADPDTDLSATAASRVYEFLDSDTISVWGAKQKHLDHYQDMQPGDLSIFIDTSKHSVDHCMEVDLLLSEDIPRQLRQDFSSLIWRDDGFEYLWFSDTPIERCEYSTDKLEQLICQAEPDFEFPSSWFSMGDDFEQLDPQTLLELGGQEAFHDELRSEGVTTVDPQPETTLLVNQANVIEQDHWAVAAKFTDTTGITGDTDSFETYKDGPDSRVQYIKIARGTPDSSLLHQYENDAIVLVHQNGTIVKQGRLATVEGKVENGTTMDLATIYDLRSTPDVRISEFQKYQTTFRELRGPDPDRLTRPVTECSDAGYTTYLTKAYGQDIASGIAELEDTEPLQSQVYREAAAHIVAGRNVVFYGPPGTGKTRAAQQLTDALDIGLDTATANAEWSNYDVVGGYEPAGPTDPDVEWTSKAGFLSTAANSCTAALTEHSSMHWLLIDELNRANLDQAFGDVFTLLDIDYRREQPLKYGTESIYLPLSFRLLATMNTSDRAKLFSLGYAFRRRFAFVPVPPLFATTDQESVEPAVEIDHPTTPNSEAIREIVTDAVVDDLTRQRLLPKAWDTAEMPAIDAAALDPAYAVRPVIEDALETVLVRIDYGWGDTDPLNIVIELMYALSSTEYDIVEIGQALAIDILRFLVAAQLLSTDQIDRSTVDRALVAYLLPQVDVFMSELRKEDTLQATTDDGKDTPAARFAAFTTHVRELGLAQFAAELEQAAKSYSVL